MASRRRRAAIAVGATFAVTRQSVRAKAAWQVGAAALIVSPSHSTAGSLGAHYLSDIVGGALFGGLVASGALLIAGVVGARYRTSWSRRSSGAGPPSATRKRCAVIYNPAKVTDWVTFRRHVDYELDVRGWRRRSGWRPLPTIPGARWPRRRWPNRSTWCSAPAATARSA